MFFKVFRGFSKTKKTPKYCAVFPAVLWAGGVETRSIQKLCYFPTLLRLIVLPVRLFRSSADRMAYFYPTKMSTGRPPIFILAPFRSSADRMVHFYP